MLEKVRAALARRRIEKACGRLATDWLVRECAPAFLRTAGLTMQAETLENLPAMTSTRRMKAALPTLSRMERSIAIGDVLNGALANDPEAFSLTSAQTRSDRVRAIEQAVGRDAVLLWVPSIVFDETESITDDAVLAATILATESALASTVKASQASQNLLLYRIAVLIGDGGGSRTGR